jgi:hypothetical protein
VGPVTFGELRRRLADAGLGDEPFPPLTGAQRDRFLLAAVDGPVALRVTRRPRRFRDQDLVDEAVGLLEGYWDDALAALAGDPAGDPAAFVKAASAAWRAAYRVERQRILDVVRAGIRRGFREDELSDDDLAMLEATAAKWLDAFGGSLVERLMAEDLEAAARAGEDVMAILRRAPERFGVVMQPLLRKLLSLGAMQRLSLTVQKTLLRLAVIRSFAEGVPASVRYEIVPQPDACEVCQTIADAGGFKLRDALAQFDAFMEAADEYDSEQQFADAVDLVPFPSLADVEDLSVRELTSLGHNVPPFHPHCRCGIALVD